MDKILDEVKGANSIGITGHIRPDGDCVGSCLGMYLYLKKVMPEDTVIDVILETIPEDFRFLKGADEIREYPRRQAYDVFIVIDSTPDRTGTAYAGYEKAKKTVNIDHHISNEGNSDINYIYPGASSASELVYDVIDRSVMDEDIAKAIYIGIIHDTGVMQYSNTSPKTLRTVADLIGFGFDFPKLIDETFYEKTYLQNKLLGKALTDSELHLDGRLIISGLSRETLNSFGASSSDMEGIVNQLRNTAGIEVAAFTYELEPGSWKVSLRSNGLVDVSKVASGFGGGGHVRAAGCNLSGSYEEVVKSIADRISDELVSA